MVKKVHVDRDEFWAVHFGVGVKAINEIMRSFMAEHSHVGPFTASVQNYFVCGVVVPCCVPAFTIPYHAEFWDVDSIVLADRNEKRQQLLRRYRRVGPPPIDVCF